MKLFYDLRLGYFVSAPGLDSELSELYGKAGDTEEVVVQFGRSSDPTGSNSLLDAPTWTAENLAGGTVITIGIKEDGEYSDGTILATTSTFTHNATDKIYTASLGLNTTAINTALERLDTNAADDIASLDCQFELTFQLGGSGGWRSSVLPVPFTLYHDILGGSEGTPTNAAAPDEYLLKAAGIEFYSTVTSKTGGTSADLDAVPTTAVTVGKLIQFRDTDASPTILRTYQLQAGTDAESSPDVIRPDDYNASTNAKIWRLQVFGTGTLGGSTGGSDNAILRADGTGGATLQASGITIADGATGTLSGTNSGDLTLSASVSDIFGLTGQSLTADDPGADRILFWDDSAGALKHLTAGSGLTISGTTMTASGGSPVPSGVVNVSTDPTDITTADNGQYIKVDTSGGSVTCYIDKQADSAWAANSYFWIIKTSASNSAFLSRDTGVALYEGNSDTDVTLTAGTTYLVWREASDTWRIIAKS